MRRQGIITDDQWQTLVQGRVLALHVGEAEQVLDPASSQIVFPGAFNPLHEGHRRMAEIASEMLAAPVAYELSIQNVDKPPLELTDARRLAAQFQRDELLWVTNTASFLEKSAIFSGAVFVVGADTIARAGHVHYYGNNHARRLAAIEQIAARGCRFLVFARQLDGRLISLDDLDLPTALLNVCDEVPRERFRYDISSTQLRGDDLQ